MKPRQIDKPKKDIESGGGTLSDRNITKKRNYTPYIIGGVIAFAILLIAMIIF